MGPGPIVLALLFLAGGPTLAAEVSEPCLKTGAALVTCSRALVHTTDAQECCLLLQDYEKHSCSRRGTREQLLREKGELMDPMPHLHFLRRVCAPGTTARTKELLTEQHVAAAEWQAADRGERRGAAAGREGKHKPTDAHKEQLSVLPVLTVEEGLDTRPASLDIHLRGPVYRLREAVELLRDLASRHGGRPRDELVGNKVQASTDLGLHLPPTHQQSSSQQALEQLRATKGTNRYAMERRSSIISIGLTFHSAPVDLREKLAVPEPEWPRAMTELCAYPHVEEAAVLSTCNRMELYIVGLSFHRAVREVEDWLCRTGGVPLAELRPHLFLLRDGDAAAHLLHVAAGLDSMVLGEGQILAQVKQVSAAGQGCPAFGRLLHALFKAAVTAGKRVRAETGIAAGAVSVSSAAAELAATQLPGGDLASARIAVLGAGKMARLLARHLAAKGARQLTVVNRSTERTAALAADCPELEIESFPLHRLREAVSTSDVVFTASSAEEVVVTRELVKGLPAPPSQSSGGLRRFFDIAVPRNVAGDLTPERDGARVFNVDDLRDVVSANVGERARAAAEAEALIAEEQAAFEAWRESLGAVPTIKALRGKAEAIRALEVDKALQRLGDDLTAKHRRAIEDCTRAIVNKLLHGPMAALRGGGPGADCADPARTLADIEALERMFDLTAAAQEAALAAARGRK